jgi:hypothetical protein
MERDIGFPLLTERICLPTDCAWGVIVLKNIAAPNSRGPPKSTSSLLLFYA